MAGEISTFLHGTSNSPRAHPSVLGSIPVQVTATSWAWRPVDEAVSVAIKYWIPNWQPNTYLAGTATLDSGWLMLSNKDTADRPSPQASDVPKWSMADAPVFATNANTSVVYSGHSYTFLKDGWVDSLRVWVPELSATTHYRFVVIFETAGGQQSVSFIEEPVLNANSWTYLGLSSNIVLAGSKLTLIIDSLNSGSDTNISGGWTNDGTSNTEAPATGSWNKRTQDNIVRIHKTDLDTTDRSTELEGVIIDSIISFVQTDNSNRSLRYRVNGLPIDNGTYMEYPVTRIATGPEGGPAIGEPCTTDIDVPVPQSTQYVQEVDTWNTQPDWATVTSFLEFDGTSQNVDNDGFGIDVRFQEADISPDWDLMSLIGSGGATSNSAILGGSTPLGLATANAQSGSPNLGISKSNDIFLAIDQDTKSIKLISESDMLNPVSILQGDSVATSQEPVALDTPLQIEFGPLQSTTDVDLAADGTVTINTDGIYVLKLILQFGRTGVPGTSDIRFRALIGGFPVGRTEAIKLTDDAFIGRVFDYGETFLPSGTTLTYEMYRDSQGHDSGGLFQATSTLAGWADAPTATVIIQKR